MSTSTRKIVAGLLSFAMVLTMVVGLTASPAAAQTPAFARNLTVGSRGADVTALQTILFTQGLLSVEPTGYFGALTQRALAAWQASKGITPAVGYFGPITRAAIAVGGTPVAQVPGCPVGALYNYLTGASCAIVLVVPVAGCPTGALFNYLTGASCAVTPGQGGTLDNTDGSLTVTESTIVSATTTLKKGETKDIISAKLVAAAGKVAVTRFDVQLSVRPWLYFTKLELVDQNSGNVVATKMLTSASDVTELSTGLSYLVRFDGLNYVVTPGTDSQLKVRATVVSSTDKIGTNTPVVTVTLTSNGIRTVNGKGYTDSVGVNDTSAAILTTAGSVGTITSRVNSLNLSARTQTTSLTGQTNGVELLKFELKSENQSSTVNAMSFLFTSTISEVDQVLKSVRLTDGTNTYYSGTIATTTSFSNLNINLPQDSYKTLTLVGDIADQDEFTIGTAVTVGLNSAVTAYDSSFASITSVSGAATSSALTLQNVGIAILNPVRGAISKVTDTATTSAEATLTFTVSNTSNDAVYLSANVNTLFATSSTNAPSTISYGTVSASGGTLGGDLTGTHFIVPNGASRTFSVLVVMNDTNASLTPKDVKVISVRYDDDVTGLNEFSISSGLDNLMLETSI